MNEPGVAELGGATPGVGVTDDTSMQMHQQCRNEQLCTGNRNEASNLHTETVESRESTAAAESLNQYANQMPNKPISNQQIEAYMKELDTGDADAMCELARDCLNNSISDEAVRQVADHAVFKARLNELARSYALGFVEPYSDSEAFQFFKQAEADKDPAVLCALGRCYNFGWGTAKDVATAISCYIWAADAGSYEALDRLEQCKSCAVDQQLAAAFEHFRQQTPNANALFCTGSCLMWGVGCAQNAPSAVKLLRRAVKRGSANAMVKLGIECQFGCRVALDHYKAFKLFVKAAELGSAEGELQCGLCHKYGICIQQNLVLALEQLHRAAQDGSAEAADVLSRCYESGNRVSVSQRAAQQYFAQAAAAGYRKAQIAFAERLLAVQSRLDGRKRAENYLQKALSQGSRGDWFDIAHVRQLLQTVLNVRCVRKKQLCSSRSGLELAVNVAEPAGARQCLNSRLSFDRQAESPETVQESQSAQAAYETNLEKQAHSVAESFGSTESGKTGKSRCQHNQDCQHGEHCQCRQNQQNCQDQHNQHNHNNQNSQNSLNDQNQQKSSNCANYAYFPVFPDATNFANAAKHPNSADLAASAILRRRTGFCLARLVTAQANSQLRRVALKLIGDCHCFNISVEHSFSAAAANYEEAKPADSATLCKLAICYARDVLDCLREFGTLQRLNLALRREIDASLAQLL